MATRKVALMSTQILLTRDEFKERVFARDGGKCVFCGNPAVDAHHIIERRLFDDGGYFLDNGASVCAEHHVKCEWTVISVEDVLAACGIRKAVLPPHLDDGQPYDKWGNPVLPNGTRMRGELFHEEGVQKALRQGGVLDLFTNRYKYPRTPHLPFSASVSDDDRVIDGFSAFEGRRIVVTVKMDGENTTLYNDYLHARSIDGRSHPSRDWLKAFWATIRHDIPDDWRVCGENLFARHSIAYDDLRSFFYGFSVWNDRNVALSWDDTREWFDLLGIAPVEVLYDGVFDLAVLKKLASEINTDTTEGFVGRLAGEIHYRDFGKSFFKWVRPKHVQTDQHWMHSEIVPNRLSG